jgi:hypothetical protein
VCDQNAVGLLEEGGVLFLMRKCRSGILYEPLEGVYLKAFFTIFAFVSKVFKATLPLTQPF